MFFYFDEKIRTYEKRYQWDESLKYLETLYLKSQQFSVLNALVGYSWLYLVEGPLISGKYQEDTNILPLQYWKKYIDIGTQEAYNNSSFNFIAGYTLSLHGLLINDEYEHKGPLFLKICLDISDNIMLQQLAENFLKNEKSSQYIPLKEGNAICAQLFKGESLLDGYFNEIYT